MNSNLNAPHYRDEQAAYDYVESYLWPTGPVCPHCNNADAKKIGRLNGKTTRIGLRKCYACRKPFTVKVGTIFEDSHAPLTVWLQVIYFMCSSKKGISTRQIHRLLGERSSLTTAWHMGHRIRLAMAPGANAGPLGGAGVTVEADETYLARSPKTRKTAEKHAKPAPQVFSLVERGGDIRSMYLDDKNVRGALMDHLHDASRLVTDGAQVYKFQVIQHESVDHSKFEWSRGDVHTNTLEGFFSIFKRGLVGTYQHMDKKHLDRYLAEFDFRMNTRAKLGINDLQRTGLAVQGAKGKRLMYRDSSNR
jgi:transposase-like protein